MTESLEARALAVMPGPFYVSDAEGCIVTANPAFGALVARPVEALIGMPLRELLPPHLASSALVPDWELAVTGMTLSREVTIEGRRGSLRHWHVTTGPVRDDEGQVVGLVTRVVDITEQVRGRLAAEREAAFLREVFDMVPNLIYAKDRGGQFTLANRAMAGLLDSTPERLLGHAEPGRGSASDADEPAHRDAHVLDSGQELLTPEEPRRDARGTPRWFRTTRHPLRSSEGAVEQLVGVATDITEYRNAQHARLRLNDERMESIGRLAGGIAHDFNNLLTVLRAGAEMIQEVHQGDPDLAQVARDITFASDRAARLTQHLLAYSRRQLLAPQPLDLGLVIREATGVLRRLLGPRIALRLDLADSLPPVLVDRASMEQILVNFASNARDAMLDGGSLTLRTRALTGRMPGSQLDGIVELCARDDGEGIPADVVDHIFEPFYTTKAEGKGTGLGLSTVYGIVRQSGGTVSVTSTVGQGACFVVRLPRTEHAAESQADMPPRATATDTSSAEGSEPGACILVVDDEAAILRVVGRILRRLDFRVLMAEGIEDATRLAREHQGEIDVMLLDVIMPDANGFEVARALRSIVPGVPVLHMTGHTKDTLPCEDGELERDFLHKPFTRQQLIDRIQQTLDGS